MPRSLACLRWLLATLVLLAACLPAFAVGPGPVAAIGGALRAENGAVWGRLVALAGGPGARFLVIGAASEDPAQAAARTIAILQRHGAEAEFLPLPAPGQPQDLAKAVRRLEAADAVFFTGGAQARITAAVGDGPLHRALHALHRRGGLVAGTSAGAAVMSATMFADPPPTLDILKGGTGLSGTLAPGLGFLPPEIFVDQHFLRRGRLGRLLPAQITATAPLGIGVDEDTAAIVQGGMLEVVGSSAVLVTDLSDARAVAGPPLRIEGARLYLLQAGDRLHLATREVLPAHDHLALQPATGADAGDAPLRASFYPDILGEQVLPAALERLAAGPVDTLVGLAFDPSAGTPAPRLGFEFRLARTAHTQAWESGQGVRTVSAIRLDVLPVELADPLYRPWPSARPG